MNLQQRMVRAFHAQFGLPIGGDLLSTTVGNPQQLLVRASLIQEEAAEFTAAAREGSLIGMADALADILYVTYAAAVVLGIDLDLVFKEVHQSNMTKTPAQTPGGKIKKGGKYQPPEIMEVLKMQDENIYERGDRLREMSSK